MALQSIRIPRFNLTALLALFGAAWLALPALAAAGSPAAASALVNLNIGCYNIQVRATPHRSG